MLLYIDYRPNHCQNCGEIIPAETAAYSDVKGVLICEACADTLPPDELIEGEE